MAATPTPNLHLEDSGVARIVFDDPDRSVNVLGEPVMRRLSDLLEEVRAGVDAGRIGGLLIESAKEGSFIVGADIEELGSIESPGDGVEASRFGQAVFLELERLSIPTVAAIQGTCLGGGTELALACRYRVASDSNSTRIGLPEVQLGILPAWGGTTRLPRLIGLQAALDLILTGKQVDAKRARRLGLVGEVLPDEIFAQASMRFLEKRMAEEIAPARGSRGFLKRLMEDTAPGRRIILAAARRSVMEKTGGHYPAPLRILEVIGHSMGRSLERAFQLEAEAAGELLASRVTRNLLHVFRLREGAKKAFGETFRGEPREIADLGVVGAGVMGGGIAQLAAAREVRVRLKDIRHEPVADAFSHARKAFEREASRGRISGREAEQGMERISGGTDYSGFGQLDLVVEAVVERLDVKRTVLGEVEERVDPECILATNTSTLSVDAMAEALERPEHFCGLHFFNPVHRMPLVEIVRGERTSEGTLASVHAFARRLGKVPVVVGDGPGFLVNRILGPYLNEAGFLLAEGASIEDIDGAATAFGLPMGPLRLVDEVGIDIARHAGDVLLEAFGERMRPSAPLVRMGETDRLGRKGGKGFYLHGDSRKDEKPEPELHTLLGDAVPSTAVHIDEADIRARLLLVMINEAARVLGDGIARSAAEVDLAMVMGTGFPPFRGGLLRFADDNHPRSLVERLETLEATLGERFTPAPVLRELARDDRTFYEAFPVPDR
ncbi:MAG: 3-hydroxyacyl-CoA dehydrogenase NAD-binding domain-containing protein [Gemmatimonadota bacterium]